MSEEIAKTDIQREKGYIYFLKSSEDGTLIIARTKCGRRKKEIK